MLSFAETLAEAFESEVQLIWDLKSITHAIAAFDVKSLRVEVDFEQREVNGAWHLGFNVRNADVADRSQIALAFRIFNGVFQAVRDFIETRQPERLVFIAKDEDLAGVYATYQRRERPNIEALGYVLEGPHRVDPYTEWTLRRIKPSAWAS